MQGSARSDRGLRARTGVVDQSSKRIGAHDRGATLVVAAVKGLGSARQRNRQ